MKPFEIVQTDNQLIVSDNNKQFTIQSSLSKNDLISLMKQYIKEVSNVTTQDFFVTKINTNENWSCLFFKNQEDETVLTMDFKNKIILNAIGIQATKSYIANLKFDTTILTFQESWIENFIKLLQSRFIRQSERDIAFTTYFKEACDNFNKLCTIEILAKQGIKKYRYELQDCFDKICELLSQNKKFKMHEVFELNKKQYNLIKDKNILNDNYSNSVIDFLKDKNRSKFIEYLIEKYNCTYYKELDRFNSILINESIVNNYDIYKLIDYVYI